MIRDVCIYSSCRNVFNSCVHVFSVFIFQIGAAYQMSNVSLYVVDLKRVQPFMMNTPRVTTVVNTGVNDLPKTSGMFEIKVLAPSKQKTKNQKIS